MRVFTVDFIRAPAVREFISHDFDDLGICTCDPCDTVVIDFDVGRNGRRHRCNSSPFEGIIAFEYDFQCLPTIASTSLRKAAWLAGRL